MVNAKHRKVLWMPPSIVITKSSNPRAGATLEPWANLQLPLTLTFPSLIFVFGYFLFLLTLQS